MKEKISPFQLSALIMFAIVPTGILLVPGAVVGLSGQSAWLSVLAGIALCLGLCALIGFVCRQYQDTDFLKWIEQRWGRWIALLIGLFLTRYYMTTAVVTLREFTNFLSEEILPSTPDILLKIIIMLVVVYAVSMGIETIVRVNLVIFFVSAILMTLGLLLIWENMDVKRLLPIWEGTPASFAQGAFLTTAWLSEVSILLILSPYLPRNAKIIRTGMAGVLLAGIGILLTVLIAVATLGIKITQMLSYPSFQIVSLVEIGSFLERLEIVFISIWITTMYVKLCMFVFGAAHCFVTAVNAQFDRLFLLLLGLLIVLSSQYSWADTTAFHQFTLRTGTMDLIFSNMMLPALIAAGIWVSALWRLRRRGSDG